MEAATRLLIVDDETAQLHALCDLLEAEGFSVLGCTTPGVALAAMSSQTFDIMLSDVNLPQFDGIELVRQALAVDPDLAPVLMTGQGSIETAVEALKSGAVDFVLKPFRLSAMLPVLDRAMTVRRLKRENRELHHSLAARNAELEAANRELDAFAGRVAHDLRGPLHHMLGLAQLLQGKLAGLLDEDGRRYLDGILLAGQRNNGLITDLLNFARLGDGPMELRPLALDAVVREAKEVAKSAVPTAAVEWRIGPLPVVHGDQSLLRQVFVNLISNALKYSRKRERPVVEVGWDPDHADSHLMWVSDNGVGFDPNLSDRLFMPFQRLHREGDFEGHGLGLAHVKRIVVRHGGAVSAETLPSGGARFVVKLPRDVSWPEREGSPFER